MLLDAAGQNTTKMEETATVQLNEKANGLWNSRKKQQHTSVFGAEAADLTQVFAWIYIRSCVNQMSRGLHIQQEAELEWISHTFLCRSCGRDGGPPRVHSSQLTSVEKLIYSNVMIINREKTEFSNSSKALHPWELPIGVDFFPSWELYSKAATLPLSGLIDLD